MFVNSISTKTPRGQYVIFLRMQCSVHGILLPFVGSKLLLCAFFADMNSLSALVAILV